MGDVWVFDLDGCIVDSLTGSSLRPGTVELLEGLRRAGVTTVLWSAGGADYATKRAESSGRLRISPHSKRPNTTKRSSRRGVQSSAAEISVSRRTPRS